MKKLPLLGGLYDINVLRETEATQEQILQTSGYRPGPHAAAAMMPAQLILEWRGKVSYRGRRNKVTLPRSLLQRIAVYLHEKVS